ncbi:FAST kinase domain-containing protein 4-like [Diadema antillarum]|uniref:FAST kinase domain-containing protein 4-like n=1 Tax=Diadema antillarum TaxID=105358 RepID=UPI003A84E958
MAASVLRLALRLQCTRRFYPVTVAPGYQGIHHTQNRTLSLGKAVLYSDAVASSSEPAVRENEEREPSPSSVFFKELKTLETMEEVLAKASQHELSGNEASVTINALQYVSKNNLEENLVQDIRFKDLSAVISRTVKSLSNESLTSTLSSALHLQAQDDLILTLEGECRRRLRLLPIRYLAAIISNDILLSKRAETKALVTEAARVLELRWREIESPQLVRRLLPAAARISRPLLERVEDKTLEMLDQYSFQEIAGLTKSLASTKTRSLPILRAVSYQLMEQRSYWEVTQILGIMRALTTLGFHNPALYQEFAAHIQEQLPDIPLSVICDVAKTYAIARIEAVSLFESIHSIVASSLDKLSILDVKRILFAYGQLCFKPSDTKGFFDQIGNFLSTQLDGLSLLDKIDLVHSLAVLGHVPSSLLENTLQIGDASQEHDGLQSTHKLKLIQINTHAKLEAQSYQGPTLTPDLHPFPSDHKIFTTTLHRSVLSVLTSDLREKFTMEEKVKTSLGHVLDAEISSLEGGSEQKMAVVTFGPPCYIYSTRQLIGRIEMMLRHLKQSGYKVLEVSYHDWYPLRSSAQQIKYLEEKLSEMLK